MTFVLACRADHDLCRVLTENGLRCPRYDTPEEALRAAPTGAGLLLLATQDAIGAIWEEIGSAGKGAYGPPASNEAYGTAEAPLMPENGDPLADLLSTTNYAFLGLHEAAAATGDGLSARAEGELARFLCRIPARSEAPPELDGAWFRAFDFRRWDYRAGSADADWGARSVESGWTQGWIVALLGMRRLGTSFWELTRDGRIGRHLEALRPLFFPEGDVIPEPARVNHLGVERSVARRPGRL